jgi:hypothetical protein
MPDGQGQRYSVGQDLVSQLTHWISWRNYRPGHRDSVSGPCAPLENLARSLGAILSTSPYSEIHRPSVPLPCFVLLIKELAGTCAVVPPGLAVPVIGPKS